MGPAARAARAAPAGRAAERQQVEPRPLPAPPVCAALVCAVRGRQGCMWRLSCCCCRCRCCCCCRCRCCCCCRCRCCRCRCCCCRCCRRHCRCCCCCCRCRQGRLALPPALHRTPMPCMSPTGWAALSYVLCRRRAVQLCQPPLCCRPCPCPARLDSVELRGYNAPLPPGDPSHEPPLPLAAGVDAEALNKVWAACRPAGCASPRMFTRQR